MTSEQMGIQDHGESGRMDALKAKADEIRRDPAGAAREYTEVAREKGRELASKVNKTSLEDMEHGIEDYVRQNPGKTLGIAAGVGFLVGLMMGGRRH